VSVTYASSVLSGTADTQSVTLTNFGLSADSPTLTIGDASSGIAETLSITSSGTANFLTLAAANNPKTINVSGSGALTLNANSETTITSIDASASTGGVTVSSMGASSLSMTGGSGNDSLDMGGTLTTADTIAGGEGTDTLIISDTSNIGDLAATNYVSGFEVMRLSENGGSTSFANLAGYNTIDYRDVTTTTNVAEGTSIKVSADVGGTLNHGVKDATLVGQTNAITVTLDHGTADTDVDITTLQLDGIETISFVSTGVTSGNTQADKLAGTDTTGDTNTIGTLTAAAATTINI